MIADTTTNLRDKILDAARHILAGTGYDGLSMRRIAQAVGCKAPSIYHHFENKDRIVHTLIDEGFEQQNTMMEDAAAAFENPLERLQARARAYIDFALNNPEYYRIMYILRTDQMERYPKESYRKAKAVTDRAVNDIEKAQAAGLISATAEAETIAYSHAAVLHGAVSLILYNRLDIRLDREQFLEFVVTQASYALPNANGGK